MNHLISSVLPGVPCFWALHIEQVSCKGRKKKFINNDLTVIITVFINNDLTEQI